MKKLLFLAVFSISQLASAWVSTPSAEKVFAFKFKLKGESFEYSQKAETYEDAYEKAAQACYRHYKAGRRISEDQGLDIIDVCANPRSI